MYSVRQAIYSLERNAEFISKTLAISSVLNTQAVLVLYVFMYCNDYILSFIMYNALELSCIMSL